MNNGRHTRKNESERFFQNSKMTFPCESYKPFNMHCWLNVDHVRTISSFQDTEISLIVTLKL